MTAIKQHPVKEGTPPLGAIPRIAFVSAGQTPRDDLMHEILELTDRELAADEFGALDGLDENELELLKPGREDHSINTRLADGTSFVVATDFLETRIANICGRLDNQGYDLIVILSTGLYREFRTYTPLLHAQQVIDTWFSSISMTKCNLGVINPLKKQGELTLQHLDGRIKVQATCELRHRSKHFEDVARHLRQCDLIFMSSVSYNGEMAQKIAALAGRPIVTARNVLANSLRLHLRYMGRKTEHHLRDIEERLYSADYGLTARECEIVNLAVQGQSNKEVGQTLGISHRTVEKHRASAMSKLGVSTITGLIRFVLMLP